MNKPVVTIFYQYDPWDSTIGGIQTTVSSFIKYAPDTFDLRFVGVTASPDRAVGKWHEMELQGRALSFLPILRLEDDNHRKLFFPTTLRYTLALLRHRVTSDFMHFHRLEPALASLGISGDKTFFIHNDIHSQILDSGAGGGGTMLWRYAPKLYGVLERFLLRQFQEILSCNSDSMALYRDRYPEVADRVALIRNTVDGDIFYPLVGAEERAEKRRLLAAQMSLPEATRFLLFAGRLHPQKDPILLVRSFALVGAADVHLLIAGLGELQGEVEAEIRRLNLGAKVTLLGAMKQVELAALHQVSSLCVLTSNFEGLPLVVLEALACGTPVVSTRCGETPRLLSARGGIVSEARTPEAIASALDQVLNNPEAFPPSSCIEDAQPYSAKAVIHGVFERMLARWLEPGVAPASVAF
jgi:glycosyltransferase involved in cell wall biosynthesis